VFWTGCRLNGLSLDELPSRGQFHQHLTRAFFVQKFVQSQTLSREKLLKRLSCKKRAHKTLMKLTLRGSKVILSPVSFIIQPCNDACPGIIILQNHNYRCFCLGLQVEMGESVSESLGGRVQWFQKHFVYALILRIRENGKKCRLQRNFVFWNIFSSRYNGFYSQSGLMVKIFPENMNSEIVQPLFNVGNRWEQT